MKYFFDDIIKQPKLTINAIEKSKEHSTNEYIQAWEIATNDYQKIIKSLKNTK